MEEQIKNEQGTVGAIAYCANCGAALQAGEAFCPSCGQRVGVETAPVQTVAPTPVAVVPKKSKLPIITLIVGVLAIVLALSCFGMDVGSWENNITYGGDAYTGMQNASAQAANNVQALAEIVRFGFASVLLVFGLKTVVDSIGEIKK